MTAPTDLFSQVQAMLVGAAPAAKRQGQLLAAMALCDAELRSEEITPPPSAGVALRTSRDAVVKAAMAAAETGEDGFYIGRHDGWVYTPQQMVTTLHRQLVALGWTSTGAPLSAATGAVFTPPVWRARLDQNGLSGTHDALGTASRFPTSLPDGRVVDASRLPGGRAGFAYAANVPSGATRVEAQGSVGAAVEGTDAWLGFSFMLSRNFPADHSFWNAIMRWRNPDGSYPVGLEVHDGTLFVAGAAGSPAAFTYEQAICDISRRTWHDVLMRIKFSRDPAIGLVSVYVDGKDCLVGYQPTPGTLTTDAPNLRYGLYRNGSSPNEATVWHMGWAVGAGYGSVMLPAAG